MADDDERPIAPVGVSGEVDELVVVVAELAKVVAATFGAMLSIFDAAKEGEPIALYLRREERRLVEIEKRLRRLIGDAGEPERD